MLRTLSYPLCALRIGSPPWSGLLLHSFHCSIFMNSPFRYSVSCVIYDNGKSVTASAAWCTALATMIQVVCYARQGLQVTSSQWIISLNRLAACDWWLGESAELIAIMTEVKFELSHNITCLIEQNKMLSKQNDNYTVKCKELQTGVWSAVALDAVGGRGPGQVAASNADAGPTGKEATWGVYVKNMASWTASKLSLYDNFSTSVLAKLLQWQSDDPRNIHAIWMGGLQPI